MAAKKKTSSKATAKEKALTNEILLPPLYELGDRWIKVMSKLAVAEGEMDEELEAEFDKVGGEVAEKLEACAQMHGNLAEHAAFYKSEEGRLSSRRKSIEGKAAWLKRYMREQMLRMGLQQSEGIRFTCALQKGPPKLILDKLTLDVPDRMHSHSAELSAEQAEAIVDLQTSADPMVLTAAIQALVDEPITIDKTRMTSAIKEALKGGEKIPGAKLEQEQFLRIK